MNVRITDIDGKKPSFVQWDVDRVLYIEGTDSQPCLHFANPMLTRAIVVEAEEDGSRWICRVPNIILQTAAPIVISVFVQPDEGKTVLTDWVKVQPKLKPQDYTYEENIGYTNWVQKTQEAEEILATLEETCDQAQDLVEDIQGKLERKELQGNSIWTTTETPMPASGGVSFTQLTGRSNVPPIVGDIIVRSSRYVYDVVEVTSGGVVIGHLIGDIKGAQGVADAIWRTTASIGSVYPSGYVVSASDLVGRTGVSPKAGDLVLGTDAGETGDPSYLYVINRISGSSAWLDGVGSIKGATGATGPQGPGVTEDLRAALLQLAQKVAYVDEHGADYYQDLYNALYLPSDIVFITAVFNQGTAKVMDTDSLDSLKPMLTVFGRCDDNTSVVLTNYTLTGVLTPGTSTVTVSALGKTTTFDVFVTGMTSISAVYTQSGTVYNNSNTLDSLKADLVVTATYSDGSTATIDSSDYTLSGTIAVAGTSIITVSYGDKTTTFNVMVTEYPWFTTFGYGWSDLTATYIQYSSHSWTRGMTNPFMILMPAGTYEVSLGAYNDTQDYYYNPSSVIATPALREVDFTFTNKKQKRFANGTFEVLKPEAEDGTKNWMMVRNTFTFAEDQFVLWIFRKGTAGTTQFTDTDVTNLMNNFTIRRLS